MTPAGQYFLDGMDIWTIFGVLVESGSADFLKYPSKKDSITRNWSDAHGIDVDLSLMFFNERRISLRCAILADDENDFWLKHEALIVQLMQPGIHRMEVAEFGLRSYYVFYNETSQYDRFTRVRDDANRIRVAMKFTLNLIESEPRLNNNNQFIITQDGRFLIT